MKTNKINFRIKMNKRSSLNDIKNKITLIDRKYTRRTIFIPIFEVEQGIKVFVNGEEQTSGKTEQDFLNAVTYQLVDKTGKETIYKVAVNYISKYFRVTPRGAISGTNEKLTTAIIGEYMNGIRINKIDGRGFMNYIYLTKLRLPNSLKHINNFAFANCSGLTGALTLPVSLVTIKKCAFKNCIKLKGELIIPENVFHIGDRAFKGCKKLTGKLVIPKNVCHVGESSFHNTNITSIFSFKQDGSLYKHITIYCFK